MRKRLPRPLGRLAPTYPKDGVVDVVKQGVLLLKGVLLAEGHGRAIARSRKVN